MKLGYIEYGKRYLEISIWVTLECNFACEYCYENGRKERCYLTEGNADKIISFIMKLAKEKNIDSIWLNFHGGEPMLNYKIIKYIVDEILKYAMDGVLFTTMTTNCSIYDETVSDYICELSVSIDGKEYSHDLNRKNKLGRGTYGHVIHNALNYLKQKADNRLRMVVTPNNVSYLCENILHLYKLGFKNIIPGVDFFNSGWKEEYFDELYNQLFYVRRYREENNVKDLFVGILDETQRKHNRCFVGCDGYHFSADGKIYPCYYTFNDNEFVIGDVEKGLDEKKIDELNNINKSRLNVCEGCGNYECCESTRCFMLNKQLMGDYFTASPVVCATQRVKLKLQNKIK